jgi:hypothetical protein
MVLEVNMNPKPEREKIIKSAWIFDVDGVITNPQEKRITEPEILDQLVKRLEMEEPVALISGRAHKWITERIADNIEKRIGDNSLLDNLFISEEFGGSYSVFKKGIKKDYLNNNLSIMPEISIEVKKIVENGYSDSMFVDPDKQTMLTIEMKDNFEIEKFRALQNELVLEIQKVVDQYDTKHELEINNDTIATNIKNKNSNKKYAVRQFLDILRTKKIKPQMFIVFGDSFGSDVQMPEEINSQNYPVKFMYMGPEKIDSSKYPFPTTQTKNKFDKGTLEILKTL